MVVARVRGSETRPLLHTQPVRELSLETRLGAGRTRGEGAARRTLRARCVQQRQVGQTPGGRPRPTPRLETPGIVRPEALGTRTGSVHGVRGGLRGRLPGFRPGPLAYLLWERWDGYLTV